MAHGIQHIQATQLLELSSSCIGGVSELRNEKWLHMWYRVGGSSRSWWGYKGRTNGLAYQNRSPKYLRHETTMTYLSKGMLK